MEVAKTDLIEMSQLKVDKMNLIVKNLSPTPSPQERERVLEEIIQALHPAPPGQTHMREAVHA